MNVKTIAAAAIAGALSLVLVTACGGGDVPPAVATTTASAAPTTTVAPTTTTAAPTTTADPIVTHEETVYVEPEPTVQPIVDEPVIISCDGGPGPVLTYWSDGTVTGSTPYCEGVAESRRQAERDHNANNWRLREQSGPQIGDQCIGADIGRKGTDASGVAIVCDNYQWTQDVGQEPKHPWVDGQRAWSECMKVNTEEECRLGGN